MIEIRSRYTNRVLYISETATDIREAVEEAVRRGANLVGADLAGANLRGATLYGATLYGAYLVGANLRGANLTGATLYGATLYCATLYGANLYCANLRGADLYGADLRGANLASANLAGANLRGADGITFNAGPSGHGHLIPLDADGKHDHDGEWRITIGCWRDKTLVALRALIDDKAEWPEATGDERDRRRPYLRAVLALCEAHIAYLEGVSA